MSFLVHRYVCVCIYTSIEIQNIKELSHGLGLDGFRLNPDIREQCLSLGEIMQMAENT